MRKGLFIKGLVGRDYRDLEDVVKVARAEGQRLFRTKKHVRVVDFMSRPDLEGIVVIVEYDEGCTGPLVVRGGNKKEGGT